MDKLGRMHYIGSTPEGQPKRVEESMAEKAVQKFYTPGKGRSGRPSLTPFDKPKKKSKKKAKKVEE